MLVNGASFNGTVLEAEKRNSINVKCLIGLSVTKFCMAAIVRNLLYAGARNGLAGGVHPPILSLPLYTRIYLPLGRSIQ